MTLNEYQKLQMRTAPELTGGQMITNAALGMCGESGEVADIVKKYNFQGHELDVNHIIEELGDVLWYISLGASALGVTLDYVAEMNINKLKKRYPDGFDSDKSVNREEYKHEEKE